ncbi:MAG TPA: hypothetical protein VD794_14845 [Flavisolibacter sp.]|nr:hypothetical protein [Flavisolibacter sp.]
MNIIYRNYVEDDIDSIIQFWNANSGWDTDMNREEFNLRFCSSPLGRPILMLAINNDINEIVGILCFIPLSVTINSRDKKCFKLFGAIFKESYRSKFGLSSFLTGKHPLQQLYSKGIGVAKSENATLMYLLPDPRWGRILHVMPFRIQHFPLWSYRFSMNEPFLLSASIVVKDIIPEDKEIDILWQQSSKAHICTITKSREFYKLKIKTSHGRYKMKGVYCKNQLLGIFTLDNTKYRRQWLICDLLTINNADKLTLTLKAASNAAYFEYLKQEPDPDQFYKVAILATPTIEKKVMQLGFLKDDYSFTLAVQLLDNSFDKSTVSPKLWHISAND